MQRGHGGSGARLWEGAGADRMLHSIGALGAALGPDVLISRNLDWKTRKAVLAHELTHVRQTRGRAPSDSVRSVGAPDSREERQAQLAGAIGVPLGGKAPTADPGVLRLFDPNELLYGTITEAWARELDDDALVEAGAGLRDEMQLLAPDSVEYAGAVANNAILERELINRGLDFERRERAAEAVARRPGGPPVTFAVDSETDETYLSVTGGGASLADIATYVYGSPELAIELGEHNGFGVESSIPPGTTLRLLVGRRSDAAERAIEAGHETGAMITTKGVPASLADQGDVYVFKGPAGQLALNATQANLLLTSLRDRTVALLNIHLKGLRDTLKIRNSHEDDSWAMRNVIEWYGEVELPEREAFDSSISAGETTLADLKALVFEPDPRDTATALCALQKRGGEVAGASGRLSDELSGYFHGFVSGGATLVNQLEFARNVSLGIVAGLAGAIVAPAAFAYFAATYGTVASTGLAIGTAGLVGGTTRGTLEAAPYAVLGEPGAGDRFASGFYSGTIEGATGAAGAFVTPLVSGTVTTHLAGRYGQAFVQSRAGQYAVQGSTGAIIGMPSGVVGTALETAPALARGEMSTGDYFWGVGKGGALGFGLGGGFGAASTRLPISGLYREGVVRGASVTPRWMLAGPYSPLADVRGAPGAFHALAQDALPPLGHDTGVEGYSWVRLRSGRTDEWAPIRSYGPEQEFDLAWYADPADAAATGANFNLLYNRPGADANAVRLIGSRGTQRPDANPYPGLPANTPEPGMPRSDRRDFPMPREEFWVTMPDGSVRRMVRGHNVDYLETTDRTAAIPDSNLDRRNFTPEPQEWGMLSGRNRLTTRMRNENPAGGTQFRQVNVYGRAPRVTAGGQPVPDHIYFIEISPTGTRAWRIPFDDPNAFAGINMHQAADIDANFGINPATLPGVEVIDPALLRPAILAAAWPGPEEEEAQPLLP